MIVEIGNNTLEIREKLCKRYIGMKPLRNGHPYYGNNKWRYEKDQETNKRES